MAKGPTKKELTEQLQVMQAKLEQINSKHSETSRRKKTTKNSKTEKTKKTNLPIRSKTTKKEIKKGDNIIEVNNLIKNFGRKQVLKNVSFSVKKGETLAIVGANGAGKTVMMEIISGVMEKTSGEIKWLFKKKFETLKEEFGFQFQDSNMPKGIKTKDLIDLFSKIYRNRINEIELIKMIEIFKINDFLKTKASKLSGGQRQRLNVLLAVMHSPEIMILDEFVTGLDINSVLDIIDYIKEKQKQDNSTMIVISHQPQEIEELADRIIVLKEGQIVKELTPKQVKSQYKSYRNFMRQVI